MGGGLAGCAAAIALHKNGVSNVLIVEAGDYSSERVGESIPPDTIVLFKDLGIWEDFKDENHSICSGSCSIWGITTPRMG